MSERNEVELTKNKNDWLQAFEEYEAACGGFGDNRGIMMMAFCYGWDMRIHKHSFQNMGEALNTEDKTRRSDCSVEVQHIISGLKVRVDKLKAEYDLTGCKQTQSNIAGQLIELAGVIFLLKETVLLR
jgi:hypothetical protein